MIQFHESQFTPEQELLLWSIRVDHTKDQRIVEILSEGVDWSYVRDTAVRHGIIPLLYKRLKRDMGNLVPNEVIFDFKSLFLSNYVHNYRSTERLLQILDNFNNSGIEAIPFKGPALAVQVHGDIGMRSFSDLDILINDKDFEKMYDKLIKIGYIPLYPIDSKTKKYLAMIGKDLTFLGNGQHLDVHWKLTERFLSVSFDMDLLWQRSDLISFNQRDIRIISQEDTVIQLCVHATKHFWGELKWLADIIHLIKSLSNPQLLSLLRYSEKIGVKRIMYISFILAREFGGIRYSKDIENLIIIDQNLINLENKIIFNFFHPYKRTLFHTPPIFFLKSRERIGDKLKYFIYYFTDVIITPTDNDFKVMSIPEQLFPIYFLIRQVRLVKSFYFQYINKAKSN